MKILRKQFLKMILLIIGTLSASIFGILSLPQFGRKASGSRKSRILSSKNFKDGTFHNIEFTPNLNPNYNYWNLLTENFKNHPNKIPKKEIPSLKTNLFELDIDKNLLVWFGHSSYYMHFEGKRILVDPVFSGFASPFSFLIKAFAGANIYGPDDMPNIDILVITHDHYDHLDYQTVTKLIPKVSQIVTTLGVGEHLESWGFDPKKIVELDWDDTHEISGLKITAVTARHFSGRRFSPKTTLWASFILAGNQSKVFLGGDSGYGTHFKIIGDSHGPFDLTILDGGQYNDQWKNIHMVPEETALAAMDLQSKKLFPVHWAKFPLAHHPWNDPALRITKACAEKNVPYFTTFIGEVNYWKDKLQGENWWNS